MLCVIPGVQLTPVIIYCLKTAVEVVAAHVDVGRFAVVVVYQPESDAVQSTFCDEHASLFGTVATYQLLVYVVGEFNVRFDRLNDLHTSQLVVWVRSYDLTCAGQLPRIVRVELLMSSANVRTYLGRSFDRLMLFYLTTIC